MKKLMSLLLVAVLVAAIFAVPASADDEMFWAEGEYDLIKDNNVDPHHAWGYEFTIDTLNSMTGNTTAVFTTAEAYASAGKWSSKAVFAPTSEANVYELVAAYQYTGKTGSGDIADGIVDFSKGQIVLVAQDSGTRPEKKEDGTLKFPNWEERAAIWGLVHTPGAKATLAGIDVAAGTMTNGTVTIEAEPKADDDTSDEDVSEDNTPTGPVITEDKNLSVGKTYTVSQLFRQGGREVGWGWDANAAISYPDEDGKTLTDGVIAADDAAYDDAVWAGWSNGAPDYKELGYAWITVDLGAVTDITEAAIYLGSSGLSNGIGCANMTVEILVSDDGEEFASVGNAVPEDSADVSCVKTTVKFDTAVSGRYVQFRMVRGGWMFVSEVEVYGPASNEGGDTGDTGDTDEPIVPNGSIEDSLKEALGTAFDDAKVDYVIEAPETYKAGDEITVKVYVRNITAANGIHLTEFKLYYDNTKLLITNDIDEENENILVCVEKAPKAWGENFSRVNNDYNEDNEEGTEVNPLNDGVIIASIFTDKTTASSAVKEDDQVIFAFTFKVLDGAEGELGFVIPHAETEAALNTKTGVEQYTANGDYAITHATVVLKGKAPTCTEDGLTEGLYCPDCGKIIVEQETIPALGHTDGEWDTTLEPTCTEAGSKDLHCAVCDAVIKTEEIAALGHTDGEWFTTVEPTEDKGGVAERRCTRCDEVLETKELPPLRLLGDVDGNKEINKYDYLMVKRAVMETITLDDIQSKAADVDRKGSVDKFDYLLIKRHVMGTYKIEGTI